MNHQSPGFPKTEAQPEIRVSFPQSRTPDPSNSLNFHLRATNIFLAALTVVGHEASQFHRRA